MHFKCAVFAVDIADIWSAMSVGLQRVFSAVQEIPGVEGAGELRDISDKREQLLCSRKRRFCGVEILHPHRDPKRLG
ncbi:hypothetical protein D3C81_1883910 [compost metagenome]